MTHYDSIILGAGISGLSLASYSAGSGRSTLVLERASRTGGCFHSHRFDDAAKGFWLELGAHTCYNSYGGLIEIMERHGLMPRLLPREKVSFRMLVDSHLKSITSQLSFPELAASAWRLFTLKKEGESVSSYYGRIVGRKNYHRVFGPAFNAVISQRADDFPANMLFNKRPRRKDVLKSYTLQGGLQTITDTLAGAEGLTVLTGVEIVSVKKGGKGFQVELSDGRAFETGALVLATPPEEGSTLLREVAPELARVLSGINVETIESVGVAVEKTRLKIEPVAGIIAASDTFYSAVSRDTVPHDTFRGFAFHFKAGKVSPDDKLKRIAQVLGVAAGDLQQVVHRTSRLPSPVVGHAEVVRQIDRLIAGSGLYVTGNYFAGMAIEDCIVRSKAEFARMSGAK